MGPFDHIQQKGSIAIRPQPAQIRKEIISTVSSVQKTSYIASRKAFNGVKAQTSQPSSSRNASNGGKAQTSQPASSRLKARGKETRKRPLQPQERLKSDSEDEKDDEDHTKVDHAPKKRQKTDVDVEPDISRKMRNKKSFLRAGEGIHAMVHAAEIATVGNGTKYRPAFPKALTSNQVKLQYPSAGTFEQ